MKTPRYDPPPKGATPKDHLVAALTTAIRALEAAELLADEVGENALSREAANMSGKLTDHVTRLIAG